MSIPFSKFEVNEDLQVEGDGNTVKKQRKTDPFNFV